jgi:hypothetical protein
MLSLDRFAAGDAYWSSILDCSASASLNRRFCGCTTSVRNSSRASLKSRAGRVKKTFPLFMYTCMHALGEYNKQDARCLMGSACFRRKSRRRKRFGGRNRRPGYRGQCRPTHRRRDPPSVRTQTRASVRGTAGSGLRRGREATKRAREMFDGQRMFPEEIPATEKIRWKEQAPRV